MRTHIRMHFDKKGGECNEENYITCIVEEDRIEIPPSVQSSPLLSKNTTPSPAPSISPALIQPNQMYYCESCKYSSTYKGNVVSRVNRQDDSWQNACLDLWITETSFFIGTSHKVVAQLPRTHQFNLSPHWGRRRAPDLQWRVFTRWRFTGNINVSLF